MCVPISQEAKNVLYDMREELKNQKIIQWFHVAEIELFQPHGEAIRIPVAYCGKLSKPEYISMFDY
jgi:hypothetical protein